MRHVPLALGLSLLALAVLCALTPGWVAPYDPLAFDYDALLEPPSWMHPFGTDQFGRDMLSRTIAAATLDLRIAMLAAIGPLLAGGLVGSLVGYFGGVADMALAILLGSSLGYLGLGAQPPAAEWGVLIADGKNFFTQAPWISLFPGVAIMLCGLGFSLTGDGLAELMRAER